MFDNIGGKVKNIAILEIILGVIGSFGTGIVLANELEGLALLIVILGIISSVIGGILLYAFGQLVENSDHLVFLMSKEEVDLPYPVHSTQTISEDIISTQTVAAKCTWKPIDEAVAIYAGTANLICNNCDCVQFRGNKRCLRCGAKFISYRE